MKYTYETAGNSSYLVATFEEGKGLINYQVQMLVNNEIKNIIIAAKKQKNDDVQIFYNITSKITLAQATEKGKISKSGVLEIIRGALAALSDIEEYQLVSSGIVFEEDKIFVKPGHFEPYFIYEPNATEDAGIESLKNMLLGFVMGSKIEFSNDNFVQVLLETLNKPGFSAKTLKKMCDKYCGDRIVPEKKDTVTNVKTTPAPQTTPSNIPPEQTPQVNKSIPNTVSSGVKTNKPETVKKEEKEEKDKNPKTIIFMILQAVLLIAVAGLAFSGILNDESGILNIQYLAGVVLAAGCVDFVVYREMFKNNKADTKDKNVKKSKAPTTAKKPSVTVPGGTMQKPSVKIPNIPETAEQKSKPVQEKQPVESKIPQAAGVPQSRPVQPYNPIDEFENEDTVVIENKGSGGAYLEFYDNGIAGRININKERVVVGKLRSQCDYALNNRKISKVHAEFICRGGEYFVKDFNSTNGTYINGTNQRIQSNSEYQIFSGDRITLADVDMTLFC